MILRAPRLLTIFLAGSVTLAAPGLVLSGFTAVQAWDAWTAAQTAPPAPARLVR